jgi:hypothetical protein
MVLVHMFISDIMKKQHFILNKSLASGDIELETIG